MSTSGPESNFVFGGDGQDPRMNSERHVSSYVVSWTLFRDGPGGLGGTVLTLVLPILL